LEVAYFFGPPCTTIDVTQINIKPRLHGVRLPIDSKEWGKNAETWKNSYAKPLHRPCIAITHTAAGSHCNALALQNGDGN